ncbi:uncharacterized protein PAC_00948 [Phialocephala subalpina]|uniref:2EXR domain-containing protein n=1 Tax=Phialocephala subalpina TaxID=576137 RepID=A0A1L7WE64_9HELO|nr:uncharacterized protein PAC_00948 [Phialocephala subalpina]
MSLRKDDKTSDSNCSATGVEETSDKGIKSDALPPTTGQVLTKTELKLGPLTKFKLFPKLPVELRLKIWNLCLPHAKTIRIEGHALQNEIFDVALIPHPRDLPLALLNVCKESNETFIEHLPCVLPVCSKDGQGDSYYTGLQQLRFGDVDTIHINDFDRIYPKHQPLISKQSWVGQVKKLSVSMKNNWKVDWPQLLEDFKGLTKLEIECKIIYLPNTYLSRHWAQSLVELQSLKESRGGDATFPEIAVREFNTFRARE